MAELRTCLLSHRKLSLPHPTPHPRAWRTRRYPSISAKFNALHAKIAHQQRGAWRACAVALSLPHPQTQIDEASPPHSQGDGVSHTYPPLASRDTPSLPWCSPRPLLPGCNASSARFLINLLSPRAVQFQQSLRPFQWWMSLLPRSIPVGALCLHALIRQVNYLPT